MYFSEVSFCGFISTKISGEVDPEETSVFYKSVYLWIHSGGNLSNAKKRPKYQGRQAQKVLIYEYIYTYLWVLIANSSVDVWRKSVLLFVMIWVKANKTEALVPMYAAVFYRSLDRNSAYLDTPKIYDDMPKLYLATHKICIWLHQQKLDTPKIYLISPKTDSFTPTNIWLRQQYILLCQKYLVPPKIYLVIFYSLQNFCINDTYICP